MNNDIANLNNIDLEMLETLKEFGLNKHTVIEDVTSVLKSNYLPYALSVIVSRALPLVYDGFKPCHRKLLYTMYLMGLINGNKTKSANIVGQTMKLNPHGDSAIYETMVRLTKANESLTIPLVDSKGNFGKIYSKDMAYAASRYTEAKLEKICKEFFEGIEKGVIPMTDNYDNTMKEPEVLSVSFPNILANPNQGIAVGMASNICSFNLIELCNYTINIIKKIDNELLIPDFSTGGLYKYDAKQLKEIKETGRGNIVLKAKYTYNAKDNCIEINEIPYTTKIETIMDKIEFLVKERKIKEISDMRDESDLKNGLKITLELKKNVNADLLMQKLYKMTPLQDTFSCNFNVLIGHSLNTYQPKVLGVDDILKEWICFRKDCINKGWKYDKQQLEIKLNKIEGLKIIVEDLDSVVNIIRKSKTKKDALPNLMSYFNLNHAQAEYILLFKLNDLNEYDLQQKINEYEEIKKEIQRLTNIIDNQESLEEEICIQLEQISKKYGKPRKTEVSYELDDSSFSAIDLIEDYDCNIVLTKQGYIKKTQKYSDNQKLKDGDVVIQQIKSTNRSKLLFFTDKANVYYFNSYALDLSQPSGLGVYLPSLLELQNEKILYVVSTMDYTGDMLFSFKEGYAVKIPLTSYKTEQNRKKITNAYNSKYTLLSIDYISSDIDVCCHTDKGYYMTFNSVLIPHKTTRTSHGVRVIKVKDGYMKLFQENHLCKAETGECWYNALNRTGKRLDI